MMDAFYIELLPQMLNRATTVFEDILADPHEFRQAVMRRGYECPTAVSAMDKDADARFRFFLKVPGKQDLTGVWYLAGWGPNGEARIVWDPMQDYLVPRRRAAIMATRAKIRAEG